MAKAKPDSGKAPDAGVRARVLVDISAGDRRIPPNSVIEGADAAVAQFVDAGQADRSPEAVEAALRHGAEIIAV